MYILGTAHIFSSWLTIANISPFILSWNHLAKFIKYFLGRIGYLPVLQIRVSSFTASRLSHWAHSSWVTSACIWAGSLVNCQQRGLLRLHTRRLSDSSFSCFIYSSLFVLLLLDPLIWAGQHITAISLGSWIASKSNQISVPLEIYFLAEVRNLHSFHSIPIAWHTPKTYLE